MDGEGQDRLAQGGVPQFDGSFMTPEGQTSPVRMKGQANDGLAGDGEPTALRPRSDVPDPHRPVVARRGERLAVRPIARHPIVLAPACRR
jgi:hypothetical protein